MADYRVRAAALDDIPALVHQRVEMFIAMNVPIDRNAVSAAYDRWLQTTLPSDLYRAWLVETAAGEIAAGGGITVIAWPPSPNSLGDRAAFVYNVYTEPAHRRRGLARMILETIHAWCRANGIATGFLNASDEGRTLYESMGYQIVPRPMISCRFD